MTRHRTYKINEEYFNNIDTQEKAYILGFLYADGNVGSSNRCIRVSLSSKDIEVLEFIKNEIGYSGPIRYSTTEGHNYCHLSFNSETMKSHLMSHGVVPNKTYESKTLPECPLEFYNSMLLGIFDGDGSIWKIKNKSGVVAEYGVNFSGNESTLKEIQKICNVNNISTCKVRYRYGKTMTNSCMLDIKGSNNIMKIYNLMYENCTFSLDRKRSTFLEFIKHVETLKKKYTTELTNSVIRLYCEGISQCEIGKILNIPYSSVRTIVQRSRRIGLIAEKS